MHKLKIMRRQYAAMQIQYRPFNDTKVFMLIYLFKNMIFQTKRTPVSIEMDMLVMIKSNESRRFVIT